MIFFRVFLRTHIYGGLGEYLMHYYVFVVSGGEFIVSVFATGYEKYADRAVFGTYYNAIKSNANIKAPNVYAYFKALRARVNLRNCPSCICMA